MGVRTPHMTAHGGKQKTQPFLSQEVETATLMFSVDVQWVNVVNWSCVVPIVTLFFGGLVETTPKHWLIPGCQMTENSNVRKQIRSPLNIKHVVYLGNYEMTFSSLAPKWSNKDIKFYQAHEIAVKQISHLLGRTGVGLCCHATWLLQDNGSLAGGNSTILLCSSRKLGKWSNLITLYFSDGVVQPATRIFKSLFIWNTLQGTNISSFSRYFCRWCFFFFR